MSSELSDFERRLKAGMEASVAHVRSTQEHWNALDQRARAASPRTSSRFARRPLVAMATAAVLVLVAGLVVPRFFRGSPQTPAINAARLPTAGGLHEYAPDLGLKLPKTSGFGADAQKRGPAPWSATRLRVNEVPSVFVDQWMRAANRKSCALLVPRSLGEGEGAEPTPANFGDGWGVSYDMRGGPGRRADEPHARCEHCGRSTFGIAGADGTLEGRKVSDVVEWDDGSIGIYGPSDGFVDYPGGAAPAESFVAHLSVSGQGRNCLHVLWTELGKGHLEYLIGQLRFVSGAS